MKAILIMMGIMLFLLNFIPVMIMYITKTTDCLALYVGFFFVDIVFGVMVHEVKDKL